MADTENQNEPVKGEEQGPGTVGQNLHPETLRQSQSAPPHLEKEPGTGVAGSNLFMWSSPVQMDQNVASSSSQLFQQVLNQDQQHSTMDLAEHFSREMFMQTGRFQEDINMLMQKAVVAAAQSGSSVTSPGQIANQEDSILTKDEEALKQQLMPHISMESPGKKLEEGLFIDNRSIEQSNFSVGEMSLSADSYILEESATQSPRSGAASMDQSIRSAIAGLDNRLSDASEHGQAGNEEDEDDDEIHFTPDNPSSRQMTDNLNESFSSEVTEPEEPVQQEPPIALLMYSQPKVWTDDSGEPTKLEEEIERDQDEVENSSNDEENAMKQTESELGQSQPSAAGLWLQDDMLQTIVPYRKVPSYADSQAAPEPDVAIVSQQRESHVEQAQEKVVNVSASSGTFVQSSGSVSVQKSRSNQTPALLKSHKDVKNNSTVSVNTSQKEVPKTAHSISHSKIPQSAKNVQRTKRTSSQNTSSSSLKNTSSESLASTKQSKPEPAAQLNREANQKKSEQRVASNTSQKNITKYRSPTQQNPKKKLSKPTREEVKSARIPAEMMKSKQSHDISHRSISSISSASEHKFETDEKSHPVYSQKKSPKEKMDVGSSANDQLSPQEIMLQQLHQSRMALQAQGHHQNANVYSNLQTHEISTLKKHVENSHAHDFYPNNASQSQNHPAQQSFNVQPEAASLQQYGQAKGATQTLNELLGDVGTDVFSMEQVRGHLHTMLKQTSKQMPHTLPEKSYEGVQLQSLLVCDDRDESFASDSTFPTAASKSLADLTAQMESLGSGSIPNFSQTPATMMPPQMVPRGEATLSMENQLIRESLEKEMFRRKHCEKQIHLLQGKLLEVQQQLAVAMNTDRKKDTMIEQLDKALAKVVDGWRKREAEKVEVIQKLQTDNQQLVQRSDAQQELLRKFEAETAVVVEQLTAAQQSVEQANRDRDNKLALAERKRLEMLESFEDTQDKLQKSTAELEHYQHKAETLGEQLCDTRATLEAEREAWEEKEHEFLQKIDEITNNHIRVIEQGKLKSDQQQELLRETHDLLTAAQSEVHELRMKLDSTTREKESLHVQLGILESKMENSLRKQEADLRSEAERELSEKLSEAHRRQRTLEEEQNARHRTQITDLSHSHASELKDLTRQHQDALRRKDEAVTEKALEFEEKLNEGRSEIETLKGYVQKLEGQRMEVTARLQQRMQAHFTEALGILMNGDTAMNPELSASVKKQLGLLDADSLGISQSETNMTTDIGEQQEHNAQHPHSSTQQQCDHDHGFTAPTSSKDTAGTFSSTQYSFSPPEPLVPRDAGQHHQIQPQTPQHQQQHHQNVPQRNQQESRAEQPPSRIPNEVVHQPQPETRQRDPNTSLPFQMYSLPGYQGQSSAPATIGFHGNQSYRGGHQVEHHPDVDDQQHGFTHSCSSGYHSNQEYQQSLAPNDSVKRHEQTNLNVPSNIVTTATKKQQTNVPQSLNQTASDELETRRLAQSSRPVISRLEPSFLETLASEAERQIGGKWSSQNSSMLSEYEGFVPLPPDSSVSMIHDDGTRQNMSVMSTGQLMDTVLSTGTLGDTTRFSESHTLQPQQNDPDYSAMSERFKQHDERQTELQKYIKMLLNRSPEEGAASGQYNESSPPSQDVSLLTPTKSHQPSPVQVKGQSHPPGVAFAKTTVNGLPKPDISMPAATNTGHEGEQPVGAISPSQAGEISRLLGIYRNRASGADPTSSGQDDSANYFHKANVQSSKAPSQQQKGADRPTREQQQENRVQQKIQVIKVPTGSEPATKSSPTRGRPATKGPTKGPSGARQSSASGKPGQKSTTAPPDKKEKTKSKVWK